MAGTNADFYSLVQRRIWNDAGFRGLSKPKPNARDLFLYLLTTPHATQIPGLIAIGESAMAEDLEWPVAGLRKCLLELEEAGMVKVDRTARLLWLPRAMKHNAPKSPDNVLGWAKHWRMLPECALLAEAGAAMMTDFAARGGSFPAAFAKATGLSVPPREDTPPPTPKGDPMGGPVAAPPPRHQTQEQDQEQKSKTHTPRAQDEDRATVSPRCSQEDLAAILRSIPPLADIGADSVAVCGLWQGFDMVHKAGATVALATQAIGALVAQGIPEGSPESRRKLVGKYLGNQRPERRSDRGVPVPVAPATNVVLDIFGEVWGKHKRMDFVRSEGDEGHASAIVELAREHVTDALAGRDIVRHWTEQYLRDADRYLADAGHPLALLPRSVGRYGLPKPRKPKPPSTPPAEAANGPLVPPPLDLLARLTGGAS